MNKITCMGVLTMGLAVSSFGFADTNAQIGAGLHGSDIQDKSQDYDAQFNSAVFSARLLPSEHFAIETNYYVQGGGDYTLGSSKGSSSFDTSGLELNLLLSTDMVNKGFYAYTGVGYFSEKWKSNASSSKYDASGLQIPVGVGYNFGKFSIDLQYAYRDPDAYDGSVFDSGDDISAATYQLKILTNL